MSVHVAEGAGPAGAAMRSRERLPWGLLALLVALLLLARATPAAAHADLVRAEPPADGLVLTAPSELRLFFSEEVADGDPKPSFRVLNDQGEAIEATPRPVADSGNPRELIVDLGPMGEGVFTVEWSVQSSTDGHLLRGTYAFRVGGGVPPGLATTEGERPAPWAVALRWATFLGVAVGAAGFLFGTLVARETTDTATRRRMRLAATGLALALLASLLEPVLLALFPPGNVSLSVLDALHSLPTAWWWRPGALVPTLALALVVLGPLRGRLSRPLAWLGGVASLLALLGLSLTSHAAGLEDGRALALASDIVHQVAVALWAGGLVHLTLWWSTRDLEAPVAQALRRFSGIALVLFALSVATGVLNTWQLLPALSALWESDYGIVLLIKLGLLVMPLLLAAWHRVALRRIGAAATEHLARLRRTVRLESALAVLVLVPATALALSAPPVDRAANLPDEITIAMPATAGDPDTSEPEAIVHLTYSPGRQGENDLRLRLTDLDGAPLPADPQPRVTAELSSLDHAVSRPETVLKPLDLATRTYGITGLSLTIDGWWRIRATVRRPFMDDLVANFYVLVPDPNVNGFDAPPTPSSDPEAEALLNSALTTMGAWVSVRWWQALSGGNDSLVIGEYAVTTTAANGEPNAFMARPLFAGAFEPRTAGVPAASTRRGGDTTITIGDRGWSVDATGTITEQGPAHYLPIDQYPATYQGADHVRLGGVEQIDGEEARIVTFHTPGRPDQSEAWFVFWIGDDTNNVLRLAMVARNHYMVTEYVGTNEDFVIEVPAAPDAATPSASPVASPAPRAATPPQR